MEKNMRLRKSDIDEMISNLKNEYVVNEEELDELVGLDGSLIDNDDYRATDTIVKAKGTSDEFRKRTSQGPGAYYPYGGAYYGGIYRNIVENGDEEINEDDIWDFSEKELPKEYEGKPAKEVAKFKMESLLDEMLNKKQKPKDIFKKPNLEEEDQLMHDVNIPEFSELKTKFEKPMVFRKTLHLLDLINKENLSGVELAIILDHLLDSVDVNKLSKEHRDLLCKKLQHGEEE